MIKTYTQPVLVVATHGTSGRTNEYASTLHDGSTAISFMIREDSYVAPSLSNIPFATPVYLPFSEYSAYETISLAALFPPCMATNIDGACAIWGITLHQDKRELFFFDRERPVIQYETIHTCKCGWQTPYPIVSEGVYVCQSCKMMKEMF